MEFTPKWEYVSDMVMGGVSIGEIRTENIRGRIGTRLTGDVSLDNNGGFLQMAFDLLPDSQILNAESWTGIELDVIGNLKKYDCRLRTDLLARPWQSYRTSLVAPKHWTLIQLPFAEFRPHRTTIPLDLTRIRRIGVLAIGREFNADVAVSSVRLFR
tara:strand:- start:7 stop:477 length:471 start_codon:yes stop_codon:yes gene_type:complete